MANVWTLKKPEDIAVSQITKPIWGNTYCGDVTLYNVSTSITPFGETNGASEIVSLAPAKS